jgi:hypothetical protein
MLAAVSSGLFWLWVVVAFIAGVVLTLLVSRYR